MNICAVKFCLTGHPVFSSNSNYMNLLPTLISLIPIINRIAILIPILNPITILIPIINRVTILNRK